MRLPGVPPVLPPAGLGRARRRRDLGRGRGHAGRGGRPARPAGRRPRHHQPAGDGGGVGPAHRPAPAPGHRVAGPAHRRPAATSSARTAGSTWSGRPTGLVLDPYFSATKLEWLLTEGGVDAERRPGLRHRRRLDPLAADRRRGPRHRPVQRQPDAALRHPAPWPGATSWPTCSACRPSCLPEVRPVERPVRRDRRRRGPRPRGRGARSAGWPATSRPRCSARPASSRA